MIISHVSIGTSDVPRAISFYDSVLATLSIKRSHYIENIAASYGDQFEFWVSCPCKGKASEGNGTHIAFKASSQSVVDDFHRVALELGGTCDGAPGLRPEYGETYYAAYIKDLDGNKIEAVSA